VEIVMRIVVLVLLLTCASACQSNPGRAVVRDAGFADATGDGGQGTSGDVGATGNASDVQSSSRGFPAISPWLAYYSDSESMGDLAAIANKFRIIDIDVDPGLGNFTQAQVTTLKNNGRNRVISYFNLGSCENFRQYWDTVPAGFLSCSANKAAQLGTYEGWPGETWMNLGNADYQHLVLDYLAPNLVSLGVDGFYFDNLDIVDHGTATSNGPCNAACIQGALDVVRKLREKYPNLLFVMQNAVGDNTLTGSSGGIGFPQLLDGVVGENTFTPLPNGDASLLSDLLAWKNLGLAPGGRAFWIGTVEYLPSCDAASIAKVVAMGTSNGFTTYVGLDSDGLSSICPSWLP
jgi:cysteinyl-tRNA synthetase